MDTLARPETKCLANYSNKNIIENKLQSFAETISYLKKKSSKIDHLKSFSLEISKLIDLNSFQFDKTYGYLRNKLATDESGWEILLIYWSKGHKTAIHGHPQLCSYNYLDGRFKLELFEKVGDRSAKLTKTLQVHSGDLFNDCGNEDTFCNHIHRIECLSDEGFSLHIYSDDASKGDEFDII